MAWIEEWNKMCVSYWLSRTRRSTRCRRRWAASSLKRRANEQICNINKNNNKWWLSYSWWPFESPRSRRCTWCEPCSSRTPFWRRTTSRGCRMDTRKPCRAAGRACAWVALFDYFFGDPLSTETTTTTTNVPRLLLLLFLLFLCRDLLVFDVFEWSRVV